MILCNPEDASATWLRDGLRVRGYPQMITVSVESLLYSPSLTHRVSDVRVSNRIVTHDGKVVGEGLLGTVNRTQRLPLDHLAQMSVDDRNYAAHELNAIFTSVLLGLEGVVINRSSARGLSGPVMCREEWLVRAAMAGLDVGEPDSHTGEHLAYVVGSQVVPRMPPAVASPMLTLARDVGVELLRVSFSICRNRWVFNDASTVPDLRPGGPQLLDAVAAALP